MATTTQNKDMQDQAATAALKATSAKPIYPLDADNKLSSASAATSLKRAKPQDLPSFPSSGIADRQASAGAAASLAFAEQKQFEHWKPEQSHPAGRAALLAHDSKPPEFWQPEASAAGSRAALLAHKNTTGVNIWKADPTSEGNSAAGIAMRGKPKEDPSATKSSSPALGSTRRARSESIPVSYTYPDSKNSASNALKAATKAHAPKSEKALYNDLPGFTPEEAARIHKAATTNMDRAMYTSSPPVAPEVEEKNRQAGLRAAAVSMAKNMMAAQEKAAEMHANDDGQAAARASHGKKTSVEADRKEAAVQYLNLQDAAKKLAAERLAKINDESEEYRQYYGAFSPAKSRMSLRARRRSSSDGQLDSSDRARSEKIRSEMSIFNSKLADVDAKKRQSDRDALLATAQRNVQNNMKGLDERVFMETGKVSPAMKAQWDAAAKEKAEKDSKLRMQNHGKIHIGGGKFMDQSEVDAIAAARVQPTLDEVTRKAEEQRALDEQRRLEAEEQRKIAEGKAALEKERKQQAKQTWSQFKTEEKERQKEEKELEKQKKEEEEVKRIYDATAAEQDRKARAAEEEAARAAAAKEEAEHNAKLDSSWAKFKETERKQKEEEKARKSPDKRKSRIGSMFASIGFGDKDKKDDSKESKGKAPAVTKPESSKVESVKPEPVKSEPIKSEVAEPEPIKAEAAEQEPSEIEPTKSTESQAEPTVDEPASLGKSPDFGSMAVKEAFSKISKHEESSNQASVPALPESEAERLALAEAIYVPTDLKKKSLETSKTPPSSASPPAKIATSPTAKDKQEKEDSKSSWFKRKFSLSRSGKDSRPNPGTIGKLKQSNNQDDKAGSSRAKDLKISAPVVIGSSAIATSSAAAESMPSTAGTASTGPAIPEESGTANDTDDSAVIASASALPSHMSTVHRTDTETNLSERDVALAGKEEGNQVVSPLTATPSETALGGRTEPVSTLIDNPNPALDHKTRSRSTSISSLASDAPSGSMRGVATAALAASQHLDAEEAQRLQAESDTLRPLDTSRTSESQEFFQEARESPEDLAPPTTATSSSSAAAAAKKDLRSVSAGSGHRETKFHEEL